MRRQSCTSAARHSWKLDLEADRRARCRRALSRLCASRAFSHAEHRAGRAARHLSATAHRRGPRIHAARGDRARQRSGCRASARGHAVLLRPLLSLGPGRALANPAHRLRCVAPGGGRRRSGSGRLRIDFSRAGDPRLCPARARRPVAQPDLAAPSHPHARRRGALPADAFRGNRSRASFAKGRPRRTTPAQRGGGRPVRGTVCFARCAPRRGRAGCRRAERTAQCAGRHGNQRLGLTVAGDRAIVTRSGRRGPPPGGGVARGLRGSRFGIDEQYLTVGQALACGLAIDEGAAVSDAVRAWRGRASAFATPYFVLAAKVTTAAIAATLETLRGRLGAAGMSEVDVERVLGGEDRRALGRLDNVGAVRGRHPHMNVHAASRTTRASLPTDDRMGSAETSLKIDAGVFLMEPDGLVRAATDMGRTLVQGGAALEMYDVLRRAVADHAVPAACAGASGRDVFLAATGGLDAQREAIDRTGLGPRVGRFQEAYARYVGHTMDKQRHVSVHFTSTSTERLEVGMTGSIELPWAWDRYGLQYEDMFWAGEDAGLNLTRDIP